MQDDMSLLTIALENDTHFAAVWGASDARLMVAAPIMYTVLKEIVVLTGPGSHIAFDALKDVERDGP